MSRLGAFYCHKGHDTCCHCGAAFKPAPYGRYGSDCDCPSFAADLHDGPCDGQRWWGPRGLLAYLPRLSPCGSGRNYLLDRVSLADGQLTHHYVWDTPAGGEATSECEVAEEGSLA